MAHKQKGKSPIKRECLEEAIKLRKTSIRKLGNAITGVGWSEKTIRRALTDGVISTDLLNDLAKALDVDPYYLMGKYHENLDWYKDSKVRQNVLAHLQASRFPYLLQRQRDHKDNKFQYERYIENVLMIHDISLQQFYSLPFIEQKELGVKIEEALCPILMQYFPKTARGDDIYPAVYNTLNEVESYDPDSMEIAEDIDEGVPANEHDPFAAKYEQQ